MRVLDNLSSGSRENLADMEVGDQGSGAPVELIVADVTDADAVFRAVRGCTGIFHEAAQVSVPRSIEDPDTSLAINVTGTLRVLEAARVEGVGRVVFAASSAAYGDSEVLPKTEDMPARPLSPYAVGKLAAEHLMTAWATVHGLRTTSLRYFNVFGERQRDDSPYTGVIALFARALLDGETPTIFGDGKQSRDFCYVTNVVEANLCAMDSSAGPSGRVYNVGCGESVSVNELFATMAAILGGRPDVLHAPERAGDVRHSLASIERSHSELGWRARVSWREGLEPTLAWYRSRHEAGA